MTLQNNKYNKDIEMGEIDKVMSELKVNKACRYDCIPGSVVKIMFNSDKRFFFEFFNRIWINSKFPKYMEDHKRHMNI